MTNKKHSVETKLKMSKSAMGNKGFTGRKMTEEHKEKIRQAQIASYKNGRVSHFTTYSWNKGKKMPLHLRIKYGEKNRGANNPNWRGGTSSYKDKVRHSLEYKDWRDAVFARDNSTCVLCGIVGTIDSPYLRADHIKSFHEYPELRTAIDNGRVLCLNCDSQTNTWGKKKGVIVLLSNKLLN